MRCTIKDIQKVARISGVDNWKDFAVTLQSPDVYVIMPSDESVMIFLPLGNGAYDAHTIGNMKTTIEGGRWMFENTDCETIVCREIPRKGGARWLRILAKTVGGEEIENQVIVNAPRRKRTGHLG